MTVKLSVIGGGAAGYFGAITAANAHPALDVTIYEATANPLAKVKVSGGGRCNVTHQCFDVKKLVTHYPRGHRELIGAFHRFQPKDTIAWFAEHGVPLKAEADGRVFPLSDSSATIIDCFAENAQRLGIRLEKHHPLQSLQKTGEEGFALNFAGGAAVTTHFVLLATGGDPRAHTLAAQLGHTIVAPVPSLFTFAVDHPLLIDLAGQSMPSVSLRLFVPGVKKPFAAEGPVLITHWGLSGPAVLKLSAGSARELHQSGYRAQLRMNLLHPIAPDETWAQLLDCRRKNGEKHLGSFSPWPFSRRLWQRLLVIFQLDGQKTWDQTSEQQLRRLAQGAADLVVEVSGKGAFKDEFVTCGGVQLVEVDFRTMESKVCPGLYLAGELLDIDGVTGGFNFQNAWTTAWIAGQAVARRAAELNTQA